MFGLSFGMNSSKSKSSTDVNKTEDTSQSQSGTQSTTGTTTNTGSSSTSSSQNTNQTGTSSQNTTGQQASSSTTSQFSDSVLSGLNSAVTQLLGAIPTGPQQVADNFNHDQFIQAGMDAATSRVNSDLENSINGIYDNIGGRDDQNSMSALLANRTRSDAGASLAGSRANLEAQAQDIQQKNFLANQQGIGTTQAMLNSVLGNLKGGQTTQTGTVQTAENTAGATTNTGAQTGTENTTSQSTQLQQLQEIISQLMSGTTHTVGTEDTKSKSSSMGGGAGLSI